MKTRTTNHRAINSCASLQREKEFLKLREILIKNQLNAEVKQLEESLNPSNIIKSLLSNVTRLDLNSTFSTYYMIKNLFTSRKP